MSAFDYFYYPYINFRSETWLKKMALYADSVSRIVPAGYPALESPTLALLRQEHFVVDQDPDDAGGEPGALFCDFLIRHRERLHPRFAVERSDQWRSDLEDAHVRDEFENNRAYVAASKLSGADLDALEETDLVVRGRELDTDWIGMHPLLANAYMTLLMNRLLAGQPNALPVADFASNAVDVHIDSEAGLARALLADTVPAADVEPLKDAFVALAFEQVLPVDLEAMPIEEIWRLRRDFADEFGAFQRAVADFCARNRFLEDIARPDQMQARLAWEYEKEVRPLLRDLHEAFASAGRQSALASVGVTFTAPGLLTALAGLGVAVDPLAATIAGGALAVAGILHRHEEARLAALKGCDFAWLYRLENAVDPRGTVDDLCRRAEVVWRH